MPSRAGLRDRVPPLPILKYYLYSVSQAATFSLPIYILYFRSHDLTFAQIGALEALYTAVILGFETPTGYLGDRIGRRNSLIVGTVLMAGGAVAFAFADSFVTFGLVFGLRAVAETFKSGSTDAWLYDALADTADEERFAHVRGRAGAFGLGTRALAALAGSALYEVSHVYPWFLEGAAVGVGLFVLLTLPEHTPQPDEENGDSRLGVLEAATIARETLAKRELGLFVVYFSLVVGLVNTVEMFIQPLSTETLGIDPSSLGLLYAAFLGVQAAAASQTGRIKETVGVKRWFTAVPPLLGAGLLLVAVAPAAAVPLFVLQRASYVVTFPLGNQYINDHTESVGRATVLSGVSMLRSAFIIPFNVLGGAIAGALVLPNTLAVLGGALLVGSVGILLYRSPVVESAGSPAASGE